MSSAQAPDIGARVQSLLQELVDEKTELGVQVAAYLNGRLVVDAAAGVTDEESARPVDSGTLFMIFSALKGVTATCVHILVDRQMVTYDTPISTFWPEFGQAGKSKATVRHALTHTLGIPRLPRGVTPEMTCDWDAMCNAFATMTPLWEPGTKVGYLSLNYNWIVGEIIHRVDGRPVQDFVKEELCDRLGLDGLSLGVTQETEGRAAPIVAARQRSSPESVDGARPDGQESEWVPGSDVGYNNRADVRRSHLRGFANARSLARLYAALAEGGALEGVRLLSPEALTAATTLQHDEEDAVLGRRMRRALGYQLAAGRTASSFGHTGGGGTLAFADPQAHFSFAYTKNLHGGALSEARRATSDSASPALYVQNAIRSLLSIA